MTAVEVQLPEKLVDVFDGEADVRGAYGGRGSAKTRSFAKMTAVRGLMFAAMGISGILLCARQHLNSLADSSLAEIKAAIASEPWLANAYEVGEKFVRTRPIAGAGTVSYEFAGLTSNISSIKSKARILICWVEEAEDVTETAWQVLIPTLREEGEGWNAELWVTWNPRRKGSATDKRFRQAAPDPRVKVVEMNHRDNPWFPAVLERLREKWQREQPDTYDHVWEGGYVTAIAGAYFAAQLTIAKAQGRLSTPNGRPVHVPADPLMTKRAFIDIGGTGARADSFVIVIAQFVGREIRVLDHYEAVGQPFATHLEWMRTRGHTPGNTQIWLPHDGETQDKVYDANYAAAFRGAGYDVTVVPNQGKGAAKMRIEALRRVLPACWFNAGPGGDEGPGTDALVSALGWYHEKRDDERGIGLGPEHDWSSHSADATGLMAVVYEPPQVAVADDEPRGGGGWMG
jgi:phage terminase large subunit